MKRLPTRLAVIALLLAAFSAPAVGDAAAAPQRMDEKRTFAVSCVPKGGLTEEDREIVAEYLAENGDELPKAPRHLSGIAKATKLWTSECADAAQPVPKRLAKQLSAPPEGTARFIFDRMFVVIDTSSNRILAMIEAD